MAKILKQDVLKECIAKAEMQVQDLRSAIQKVKESIEGEEKSSAGDKYETARAMAQKEMERLGPQLEKAKLDLSVLSSINSESHSNQIQLGSLITTNTMLLFMAVPLGRVHINGTNVFVISPSSPIGQAILGRSIGDRFKIGAKEDQIVDIN